MQTRLLDAQGFKDTASQLITDQSLLRGVVKQRADTDTQHSMNRCMELCRARDARRQRLSALKRTLDHSRGFLGADPRTLIESWVSTRRLSTPSPSMGGAARPPQAGAEPPPHSAVSSALSPDLIGKISHTPTHSRKSSGSGAASASRGRRRDSSSGGALLAAQAHAQAQAQVVSPIPPVLAGPPGGSTPGAGVGTGEDARSSGDGYNALAPYPQPTGAYIMSLVHFGCSIGCFIGLRS